MKTFQPMYVQIKPNSSASKYFRSAANASVIGTKADDLKFFGGKTLRDIAYKNFYVGGDSAWAESDITSIEKATNLVMTHQELNKVLAQYFNGKPLTCTALGAEILDTPKPSVVSQGDIERFVKQSFAQGIIKDRDLDATIFNFILPRGAILNTKQKNTNNLISRAQLKFDHKARRNSASSLDGLGGYHGSVHVKRTDGKDLTIYYSIEVFSETLKNGNENGIVAFADSWKNIVATLHHELQEFRTDPDVGDAIREKNDNFLGWMSAVSGEEIGDFPLLNADPVTEVIKEIKVVGKTIFVPFQMLYSNKIHGAENPL